MQADRWMRGTQDGMVWVSLDGAGARSYLDACEHWDTTARSRPLCRVLLLGQRHGMEERSRQAPAARAHWIPARDFRGAGEGRRRGNYGRTPLHCMLGSPGQLVRSVCFLLPPARRRRPRDDEPSEDLLVQSPLPARLRRCHMEKMGARLRGGHHRRGSQVLAGWLFFARSLCRYHPACFGAQFIPRRTDVRGLNLNNNSQLRDVFFKFNYTATTSFTRDSRR
jgi:hypothetical protein